MGPDLVPLLPLPAAPSTVFPENQFYTFRLTALQHLHPCSSSHGCASSGLEDFSVDSHFPLVQKLVHSPTLLRLNSSCRTSVMLKYVLSYRYLVSFFQVFIIIVLHLFLVLMFPEVWHTDLVVQTILFLATDQPCRVKLFWFPQALGILHNG